MSKTIILIPARMASTRLPGKPLADIGGEPMIVRVLQQRARPRMSARRWWRPTREAVAAAVEKAGGRAVMTRADHVSGSDRIFEALEDDRSRAAHRASSSTCRATCRPSTPADIRAALKPLDDPAVDIATLAAEITDPGRAQQSECGQGVGHAHRRRITFARVTFTRADATGPGPHYHHIGLYAYRRAALERFVKLPPSANEQREKLEQLRALDAGMRIDVAVVESVPLGVDTPEELAKARKLLGG